MIFKFGQYCKIIKRLS